MRARTGVWAYEGRGGEVVEGCRIVRARTGEYGCVRGEGRGGGRGGTYIFLSVVRTKSENT